MSKDKLNEEAKKMKALAGIQENNGKFLNNESFSEAHEQTVENEKSEPEEDSDFTTINFDQPFVDAGQNDDKLYKIG